MSVFRGVPLARAGLLVGTVGAVVIGLGTPALAAIPQVAVSPHTNLRNGQTVKVSVKHFPANTNIAIEQCNPNGDGDLDNCDTQTARVTTTNKKGAVSGIKLKVVTGEVGSTGTCGTGPDDKVCTVAVFAEGNGQMQQTDISFTLFS